jgi:hypothetical protein
MRYSFAGWKDHANNAVLAMGVVHAERARGVGRVFVLGPPVL